MWKTKAQRSYLTAPASHIGRQICRQEGLSHCTKVVLFLYPLLPLFQPTSLQKCVGYLPIRYHEGTHHKVSPPSRPKGKTKPQGWFLVWQSVTQDLPRRGTPLQFLHSLCGWGHWPQDSLIPPAFTLVVIKHSFHVQHCLFCRNVKNTFQLLICCLNLLYDTLAKRSGNLKAPMLAHSILDSFNWEMYFLIPKKKKSACDFFLFFQL